MKTEMGEYVVGAYLRVIEQCDVIEYNVRPSGGGIEGLGELDVIGFRFSDKSVFICEVTTHLRGVLYTDYETTVKKVKAKYERQKQYCDKHFGDFPNRHFMFWSPVVPDGKLLKGYENEDKTHADGLEDIPGLERVINYEYTKRIDLLRYEARKSKSDIGNPFFRTLQLLESLKREEPDSKTEY